MTTRKRPPSVAAVLRSALRRKQADRPGYTMRALARDLGVSAAFVSNMLNGKKLPPRDRLKELCYRLELDVLEKELVVKAVMLDAFTAKILTRPAPSKPKKDLKPRTTSESSNKSLMSSWINVALLEGLTLSPPHNDLEGLRERLGLTASELEHALAILENADLIYHSNGQWRKKDELLYIAGGRPRQEVRQFHDMMIAKARTELMTKPEQTDYERRLINCFSMTVNPEHLERLKAKIVQFMDELAQNASDGNTVDVYLCNVQFFPLTKKGPAI